MALYTTDIWTSMVWKFCTHMQIMVSVQTDLMDVGTWWLMMQSRRAQRNKQPTVDDSSTMADISECKYAASDVVTFRGLLVDLVTKWKSQVSLTKTTNQPQQRLRYDQACIRPRYDKTGYTVFKLHQPFPSWSFYWRWRRKQMSLKSRQKLFEHIADQYV